MWRRTKGAAPGPASAAGEAPGGAVRKSGGTEGGVKKKALPERRGAVPGAAGGDPRTGSGPTESPARGQIGARF